MINLAVLRKYIDEDTVKIFWSEATQSGHKSTKKCPCCSANMTEFCVITENKKVLLDVCKMCQLVWFDHDELKSFPSHTPETPKAVKEAIALCEVEVQTETFLFEQQMETIKHNLKHIFKQLRRSHRFY